MFVTNITPSTKEPLHTVFDHHFKIVMSKDEAYNCRVLINSMDNPNVNSIAGLIQYIMQYYAEHAFMSIREPTDNGN